MLFIPFYFVTICYLALAAISPVATIVPNTPGELGRIAILLFLATISTYWGRLISSRWYAVPIYPNHPDEGFDPRNN